MSLYVIGTGRLGRDPEVKYTQGGMAVLAVSVGCYVGQKRNKDGSYGGTEWVDIVLFGKAAESAANVMRKGLLIDFNGYQQTEEYTDQQQQPRKKQKVIVSQWSPLEAINQQQQQPVNQGFQQQQPNQGFQPQQQQGFQPQQQQGQPQPDGRRAGAQDD